LTPRTMQRGNLADTMSEMFQIEPVPSNRRRKAIQFLAGGDEDDVATEVRAHVISQMLQNRREENVRFWWATAGHRCVAAALILQSPGRIGMLFYPPLSAAGVLAEAVAALASEMAREALAGGLALVQSLLKVNAKEDVDMLTSAGYRKLATLLYMRHNLTEIFPPLDEKALTWRNYGETSEAELVKLIEATYEQSLDCPALSEVRDASDAVAGHKKTGLFTPECWWIVRCGSVAAGCILVNDCHIDQSAEVVYMGVKREFRRKGIGRALLRRAKFDASRRGKSAIRLAVDGNNIFARRLYESEGFRITNRRLAYAILGGTKKP